MRSCVIEFMITESCNLACKYCYIKQKSKTVTNEIIDSFIEQLPYLLKLFNCSRINLSYFGGEPLLAWDQVVYLHNSLKRSHIPCTETIITNGLLITQDKIDFIKRERIGVSWSFDGLWTDTNRPLKHDQPALAEYYKKKPLFTQLTKGCKVMVAPNCVSTLTENFKYFVEEWKFPNPDFSLVRDDIWSDEDVKHFKEENERLKSTVLNYWKSGKQCLPGFYRLWMADILLSKFYGKRSKSCFAGNSGFSVYPTGEIFPCARFATRNEFKFADLRTGEIDKAPLKILMDPHIYNPNFYEQCKHCRIRNACNAACLHEMLKQKDDGSYTIRIPHNLCGIFHILHDTAIELFEKLPGIDTYMTHTLSNLTRRS